MNGYMKANILGKDRGIKFGMLAMQKIALAVGESLDTENITVLYEMVYWGLWNNCYVKKEVPDFSFEEICDWVDSNISNTKFFEELGECFKSSNIIKDNTQADEKKSLSTSKRKKAGTN